MQGRHLIEEILRLTVENYKIDGQSWTESTLELFIDPFILVQMIAWDGVAHLKSGGILHCTDWDQIPMPALQEIKSILFCSYPAFLSGKRRVDSKGHCTLKNIGTTASVQPEGLLLNSLGNHGERQDYKVWKFPA